MPFREHVGAYGGVIVREMNRFVALARESIFVWILRDEDEPRLPLEDEFASSITNIAQITPISITRARW